MRRVHPRSHPHAGTAPLVPQRACRRSARSRRTHATARSLARSESAQASSGSALLWIITGASWLLGVLSAPLVWRVFAWAGSQLNLPKPVLEFGFVLWWTVPALDRRRRRSSPACRKQRYGKAQRCVASSCRYVALAATLRFWDSVSKNLFFACVVREETMSDAFNERLRLIRFRRKRETQPVPRRASHHP